MKNYEDIGLDNKLRSLTAHRTNIIKAVDFDTQYEVQARNLNASKINLINFIKQSDVGTALGTFNLSQALNLTSTITFNDPHSTVRTFGKAAVAVYQGAGTTGTNQIYPIRGAGVTLGRYEVGGEVDFANYNGTADQWRGMIIYTNGTSSQVITFATQWIYADYVSRDAS